MARRKGSNALGWLLIFVVGSLIVNFLVNPNSFSSFKQNIMNIMANANSAHLFSSFSSDPSVRNCLEEVKDKIAKANLPNFYIDDMTIKEYKKFNSSKDAIEYIQPDDFFLQKNPQLKEEHNDVVVVLVLAGITDETGRKFYSPGYSICIDGKLQNK